MITRDQCETDKVISARLNFSKVKKIVKPCTGFWELQAPTVEAYHFYTYLAMYSVCRAPNLITLATYQN